MNSDRILIVDDEHANQFLLEGLLQANGYETLCASDGEEGLQMLEQGSIQLVLLDIMMPKMNGIEVLRVLQQKEEKEKVPVIMVSAKSDTQDVQKSLELGAIDYIRKPFDEVELLARVKVGLRIKHYEDTLHEMLSQRNDFIKIISHDLRSPFTAISGFAELLLRGKNLTESQKESIGYIIDSIEFSNDYFNKLLSWTMLDSSDIILSLEKCSLHELIDYAFRIFKQKAEVKTIRLINNVPADFNIKADKTFFRQIIANLISNAVKFTPEGGQVVCDLSAESEGTKICISDTGIGMPEGITNENLFNGNTRKSLPGTRGEKGTGFGLRICRKLLDAHKMDFYFERLATSGTRFVIGL